MAQRERERENELVREMFVERRDDLFDDTDGRRGRETSLNEKIFACLLFVHHPCSNVVVQEIETRLQRQSIETLLQFSNEEILRPLRQSTNFLGKVAIGCRTILRQHHEKTFGIRPLNFQETSIDQ